MEGILFEDYYVEIDPRSVECGGSWHTLAEKQIDGMAVAYDSPLLSFFYNRMSEIEHPYILDIGANTGSFCLLAKWHPTAKVWAFEPNMYACDILRDNLFLNNLEDQVEVYDIALSNQNGHATLKTPTETKRFGLASIGTPKRFNTWVETEVETHRLDDIAEDIGITQVDLIKIDTEGCELFILQGGEGLIRKYKPGIVLEYNAQSTSQFGYKPKELIDILCEFGYNTFEEVGGEDIWATK